jgi:Tfp pilus assembly protein PilW
MNEMKAWKKLMSNREGFTIIELMVSLVLSFILIGAVYGTFTSQQKAYTVQDQVAEAQQNARMAMNMLVRDIRMAGYGMPDTGITIGKVTYSNAIKIKKQGKYEGQEQLFDSVTIVGAFGAPSGYLGATVSPGSAEIYLRSSDEASDFDSEDNRYIFIGGIDRLEVSSVSGNKITLKGNTNVRYPTAILSTQVEAGAHKILVKNASGLASGDVLSLGEETLYVTGVDDQSGQHTITVDTDLVTAGNQGINNMYRNGTIMNPVPVFRVTAVEYSIDPYTRNLIRNDRAKGTVAELAGNIQDIQITPEDQDDQSSYTIALTAQTRAPDPVYTENKGYRQRILRSAVMLRNLR